MVWTQLTDHLQVLYGAAAALAIVVLLTPAVGSAARYLRLIERPVEGERARSAGWRGCSASSTARARGA